MLTPRGINYLYLPPSPSKRPRRSEAIQLLNLVTVRLEYVVPVDQPDKVRLEKAIVELIEKSELRAKLGQHARTLAFCNHDAAIVRQQFRQLMNDVALHTLGKEN